jgi:hypothetical protein
MKTETAEMLREAWKAKGSQPCRHFKLARERTARGDHTGDFVCCACGAYVERGPQTR